MLIWCFKLLCCLVNIFIYCLHMAFLSYEYDWWCFFVLWIWWVMTHLHAHMQMPTTIEELEAAIHDTLSQANSTLSLNQNVVEEYEHRQGKVMLESWDYLFFISFIVLALKLHLPLQALQIEAITKKLEADKEELKKCLAEIDALKVRDVSLLCHTTGIYIYNCHFAGLHFRNSGIAHGYKSCM